MSTFSSSTKLYEDFIAPNETVYDVEAIKNSIKNILLTPIGTMPGKPRFGSRFLEVPFNQNDSSTKLLITRVIYEAIVENEQRIKLLSVDITPAQNGVSVKINFRFRDSSISGSVSLDLLQ